ncbi:MAG: GNAT family protein [Clostridia bacterium]
MSFLKRGKKTETAMLPLLKTERLVLRGFELSDAVDVFAYAQNEKVGPMAGWAPHQTVEESRKIVAMFIEHGDVWAIVDKKTGRVIGSIGLHKDYRRAVEGAKELGYALGEAYWGQGFATEACRAVLAYAFTELGSPVVGVIHFPFNQKSKHVIKKLGFRFDGTLRAAATLPDGTIADECCYSLLKTEYEAQEALANK